MKVSGIKTITVEDNSIEIYYEFEDEVLCAVVTAAIMKDKKLSEIAAEFRLRRRKDYVKVSVYTSINDILVSSVTCKIASVEIENVLESYLEYFSELIGEITRTDCIFTSSEGRVLERCFKKNKIIRWGQTTPSIFFLIYGPTGVFV